jgi:hypothetical protein
MLRFVALSLLSGAHGFRVQLWPTQTVGEPTDPGSVQGGDAETSTAASEPQASPKSFWEAVPFPPQQAALAPYAAPSEPSAAGGSDNYVNTYDKNYVGTRTGGTPATLETELSNLHLTLQSLAAYPEAVCNDGTPAGYYYSPASDSNPDVILYLEGGMWCWSAQSCTARYAATTFEMSSKKWPTTLNMGGLFSLTKGNPFAKAAKAYLSYCSSDAWVGDAQPSPDNGGFAFKGQAIIEAVVTDLVSRFNLTAANRVLFGGCSAGARGALFNLDYVGAMLPPGTGLKGLLDSALWLDLVPPDAAEVSLQAQTQGVFAMVNPAARIPAACAAAYPGSEGWKCLYGQYRLPFVTTPYFIVRCLPPGVRVRCGAHSRPSP